MLTWLKARPTLRDYVLLLVIALLLLLPYLLQPHVYMSPRSGLGTDFLHYRWSSITFFKDSLQEGVFPLWYNPIIGGQPIPGNPSVFIFYPPQLIMALLPIPLMTGFALLNVLHLWIAGLGGYELAFRAMKLRRDVALIGGIAALLIPRLSSNLVGDLNVAYSMCWGALAFAWAWLALETRRPHWIVLAGMAMSFHYLIHVQFFYYMVLLIGLRFAWAAWAARKSRRELSALSLSLIMMVVVCIGLSAINLLPFMTYLRHLSRETLSLAEADKGALPPIMLISTLAPIALKYPEWEVYMGLLTLLLAGLAWKNSRRNAVLFWLLVVAFFGICSLGATTPLFPILFKTVPGFDWLRVPSRMWMYLSIGVVMLMCLGLQAVLEGAAFNRRWLVSLGFLMGVFTVAGRFFTRRPAESDWLLGLLACLGLGIGLYALSMRGKIPEKRLMMMIGVGLLLDLFALDAAFMTPHSIDSALKKPPVLATIQPTERIYAVRGELTNQVAINEGLEVIHGMNSFQFQPYVDLVKHASGCNLAGFSASVPPCFTDEISATAYQDAVPQGQLLGLLNVGYVISPLPLEGEEWRLVANENSEYLYENTENLPPVFGVGQVIAVEDQAAVWETLAGVDLSRTAVIETDDEDLADNDFSVSADLLGQDANQTRVRVEMPARGMLIFSKVWVPGWRAQVDGKDAPVQRVDGALCGVWLDGGTHEVRLYFNPPIFWIGLIITLLSYLICAGVVLRSLIPT